MTALLAAVEYGGAFKVPPVGELFNFASFGPFGLDRGIVLMLLATTAAALLFVLAFSNAKIVPGKLQLVAESIVGFVRDQVALQIIGPDGRRFVPLLVTLFLFIWFNNLLEITPLVNFPPTSRMALPLFLALISYVVFVGVGFKEQGLAYIKNVAFPPGVPWPIYFLLVPIELLSTFVLRPFTLAIRLFANMVAGHILLSIVFIATHAFFAPKFPGVIVGAVTFALSPVAVGFELFIASLQAYIFVILTAVYISGALEPEH
ncbi:F0F1 ATP synthase subunit A [soil metagenome]